MTSKYRLIWQLTAGERVRYAQATMALVLASCFLYLVPLVPSAILDGVIADNSGAASPLVAWIVRSAGGREFLRAHIGLAAFVAILLTALAGVFTYLRGRWSALATESCACRLRDRLYDQLQHLPCSFFDTAATGDLVQRCTSDVETVRMFLTNQIVEIGRAALMLVLPLPLMLAIDTRMTGVSLVLMPAIVALSVIFFSRVRHRFEQLDQAEGRLTSALQQNITGIRVVRAFARQDFEIEKFDKINREFRDLDKRLYQLVSIFWSVSDFLCMCQIAIIVFSGGVWLARGTLGVGGFFFFLSAANMFIWPVRMMGRILTELGKATVSIGRIDEILSHPRESVPETAQPAALSGKRGEIAFRHVRFVHRDGKVALDGLSFRIAPGSTIGLLGASGSGKSTIVNLLLRLYDHGEGTIEIGGRDIASIDRKQIRQRISVVMQEPFLYSKTLRENLTVGKTAATHDEMTEAAFMACIHDTVREFEHGYETLVGERGIMLSGGQRQRVALARALLKDPEILILDDALSAVDTRTEADILEGLRKRRGRSTTIVIAHRLSALADADEIFVLDRGRIVQRGTHEQLKQTPGLYRRVWNSQTIESEAS
jgi:ATP-binding cassette subfamily B protein